MYLRCLLLCSTALLWLAGCDSKAPNDDTGGAGAPSAPTQTPMGQPDPALDSATLDAWALGDTWLKQARKDCGTLHDSIQALLAAPSDEALAKARGAWRQCHNQWHYMGLWMALGESNPGLFGDLTRVAFKIDAQPLQPGYLDAIEGYPYSGIVNDITLNITAATLRDQHGLTDDSDVVLGLHALEFLLWGEAGERPAADFEHQSEPRDDQLSGELTEDQLPNNRRRELLRLISQLLQDDLAATQQRWSSSDSRWFRTYRQLHPASRLPLLREAVRQLLQDQLPTMLQQTDAPELAHNRFAGETWEAVASSLRGLQALMSLGEPPLASHLLSPSENSDGRWRKAWGPIEGWLDDPSVLDTASLSNAVQQLGETLNPEMAVPADLNEPPRTDTQ